MLHAGNTKVNVFEVYPTAILAEFHFCNSNGLLNWRSLRLVFEPRGDLWFLVGIVHDQWTI